ncbi:UDP-glucose/GDP-mannose dehydrogenase family, central domain-containing protein [Chytridium lagenaria]|nr:UDP-glucose/GDP-mannose dehydrogenase family, central domain-containing protein [Chytridium lagenaria]
MTTATTSTQEQAWKLKICCIGAGYVGGPTCAVISLKCPDVKVTIVDINQNRVDQWNSNELPIYEPGLDEIVFARRGKNLFFSSECHTPTKKSGMGAGFAADLAYVESATRRIAKVARSSKIVIENMRVILEANSRDGIRFDIFDLLNPDRGAKAQETLASVYQYWVPKERIITTTLLAANALLAQRISSVNALSAICEATGADIDEVAHACGLDSRIGPKFLKASVGFGGSCFQKDILNLVYLSESLHLPEVAAYWNQVVIMNEYQKKRFSERLVRRLFNTIPTRNLQFGCHLLSKYFIQERAFVNIYDPKVTDEQIELDLTDKDVATPEEFKSRVKTFRDPYEAAVGVDAIIVVTEWDEFKTLDYQRLYESMNKPACIFDGRLILDAEKLRKIGFVVECIGKNVV